MNNSTKSISLILAAGLAGVAFFKLADSSFVAALPLGAIFALVTSAAAIGLATYDYSRRVQPVTVPCRVLRPLPGDRPGQTPAGQQAGTGLTANRNNSIDCDRAA